MVGWRVAVVLLAVVAGACLSSDVVVCADGTICPVGAECLPQGGGCVVSSECGNRRIDPGEVCDDGSNIDGDDADGDGKRCSANCLSDETCGNNYVDLVFGEQCDDGDLLDRDGCSAGCLIGEPHWRGASPQASPPLSAHAMAYDAGRQAVVVFGGVDAVQGVSKDVWEWDGRAWNRASPPPSEPSPAARAFAAMVYDAERRRTVMFGGNNGGLTPLDDIWEWDGSRWLSVTPRVGALPTARTSHAMAYDTARKRVVLFGGQAAFDGNSVLGDTWEWDGQSWLDVSSEAGPPKRDRHSMIYDPARGRVVVFGGRGANGALNDLWEWDGTSWEERTPVGPLPPARESAAMAFVASTGSVVVFGGYEAGVEVADTWSWDGGSWTQLMPSTSPEARRYGGMVYDIGRATAVLVGGGDTPLEDTWEWDGLDWEPLELPEVPVPRVDHSWVFDPLRGKALLFGGYDPTIDTDPWFDDLWEWDGGWHEVPKPGSGAWPPPRSQHSMAIDPLAGRVLVFAGRTVDNELLGDLWSYMGNTWTQLAAGNTGPVARNEHAMAFDRGRARLVVFGGLDAGENSLADTWEWDGDQWERVAIDGPTPAARWGHAMVYDPARSVVILHGGYQSLAEPLGDLWEWDGERWTEIMPAAGTPTARANHVLVFDTFRQLVVLHGGDDSRGPISDVWDWDGIQWFRHNVLYRPDPAQSVAGVFDLQRGRLLVNASPKSQSPFNTVLSFQLASPGGLEGCHSGLDGDGDGVSGCLDPDCSGYCDPLCLPLASCASEGPRCGDGNCSAELESCRLCPQDCGPCEVLCGDFICEGDESAESCPGDCLP